MTSFSFSFTLFFAIILYLILDVSTATTTEINERGIRLHFYVQERTKFSNFTVIKFAPNCTNKYDHSYKFGDIFVFDDLLTESREPTSHLFGRLQGTSAITSLNGSAVFNTISLVFTDLHPWTGTSLTIIGSFSFLDETRELHVVGGTGRFRSAQGYVVLTSLSSHDPNIVTFELEVVLFNN